MGVNGCNQNASMYNRNFGNCNVRSNNNRNFRNTDCMSTRQMMDCNRRDTDCRNDRKMMECSCKKTECRGDKKIMEYSCIKKDDKECPCKIKTEGCDRGNMLVDRMEVAMGYVPWQEWDNIYDMETALCRGTIFKDLDKPWKGRNK